MSINLSSTFITIIKYLLILFFFICLFLFFRFLSTIGSSFQKYLIILTFIVLIVCLLIIAYTIQYTNNTTTSPSLSTECPDYFDVVSSTTNGAICKNKLKLGNQTCYGNTDFTTSLFTGTNGKCNKYKWANNCGVFWDGINYGVDNPC